MSVIYYIDMKLNYIPKSEEERYYTAEGSDADEKEGEMFVHVVI